MINDNKKIGIGLGAISSVLGFLGVIFLANRFLLCLANILFLLSICFILSPLKMLKFFFKKGKIKASVIYFFGFFLILMNYSFIGLCIQIYGFWLLFYALIPKVLNIVQMSPFGFLLGLPGISQIVNRTGVENLLPL